jgi:hypothetical protein
MPASFAEPMFRADQDGDSFRAAPKKAVEGIGSRSAYEMKLEIWATICNRDAMWEFQENSAAAVPGDRPMVANNDIKSEQRH